MNKYLRSFTANVDFHTLEVQFEYASHIMLKRRDEINMSAQILFSGTCAWLMSESYTYCLMEYLSLILHFKMHSHY